MPSPPPRSTCSMWWPSARKVRTKSESRTNASSNGSSFVIWLPICMSTPGPRKRRDHGLVGIGLHGVTDERTHVRERAGKDLVMALERRGRIAIKRRAHRLGEADEVDPFGVEHAVAVIEVVHRWR